MITQSSRPTHNTAPTRFVEADGVSFAYRRFGEPVGTPIVLLQHFMGNLDNYDPAITDALAMGREVILTDNAGVGLSTGTAPETVAGMARDAASVIDALGLEQVDVFGFSMGGYVAQQIALDRPELVRRMVLVGTGPRGGDGAAARAWGKAAPGSFDYLKTIRQPALVVNGSNDVVVATINSYILQQNLPDAELVLFPDSNHGSQFQFADRFVEYVTRFLER